MLPGLCDLIIDQGQALDETIIWKDSNGDAHDVTGYTARCQVRENKDDSAYILPITVSVGTTNGQFALSASAGLTRVLTAKRGFWSLETSPGGTADLNAATDNITLLAGTVTIIPEATK